MLKSSMLYPVMTETRRSVSLNGLWGFQIDPEEKGKGEGWKNGLPSPDQIPVPASFADFYTEKEIRDYCGDFWYETSFLVPEEWNDKKIVLRFGSATHVATVYVNGEECAHHEGGFLPFEVDVTELVKWNEENHLAVLLNNELCDTRMPVGGTITLPNGRKFVKPGFDFFNYSGLQRNIWLTAVPKTRIFDYETSYELDGKDGIVHVHTVLEGTKGNEEVTVELFDAEGNSVAKATGEDVTLTVKDAHLWQVRNAYLYDIRLTVTREGKDKSMSTRTVSVSVPSQSKTEVHG